jgi:hypothetical protein
MRRAFACLTAFSLLTTARVLHAYCRSAACAPQGPTGSTQGQVCTPQQPGDCGVELQWRQPCVSFDVQAGASKQIDWGTANATITRAFATWTGLQCVGGGPSIEVLDFGPVACGNVEYNQRGGNASILVFRDDAWPHDTGGGGVDTLALTTVTYDVDKGDIYDADIEVNTAANTFTTTDHPGPDDVDLLSVLTHETGHFLGLAHTQDMTATMFASYTTGTTGLRHPNADDLAAICDAYPPARVPVGVCSGIPRHGWAPECYAAQTYVRCAASDAPGYERDPRAAIGLGALVALAAVLRGRRGSRGS